MVELSLQSRINNVTIFNFIVKFAIPAGFARKNKWRRGWDSNPRYPQRYNNFRDCPIQPLSHLSVFSAAKENQYNKPLFADFQTLMAKEILHKLATVIFQHPGNQFDAVI
jgi:hypothetical protein